MSMYTMFQCDFCEMSYRSGEDALIGFVNVRFVNVRISTDKTVGSYAFDVCQLCAETITVNVLKKKLEEPCP